MMTTESPHLAGLGKRFREGWFWGCHGVNQQTSEDKSSLPLSFLFDLKQSARSSLDETSNEVRLHLGQYNTTRHV
jgi:hypothetical protein